MLRFSLCLLVFLFCSFAESKSKFTRKYIPDGNPGGANFEDDEEFADSYKLYEKRKESLKKKKQLETLQQKEKARHMNSQIGCIFKNDKKGNAETSMINKHGINLARLKGAAFLDQEDIVGEDELEIEGKSTLKEDIEVYDESIKENEKNESAEQGITQAKNDNTKEEKKISMMNIKVQDSLSKRRVCVHDPMMISNE